MRFWDSSAIVPLLVRENATDMCLALLKESPSDILAWWGTTTECVSALSRREREGSLSGSAMGAAISRLQQL